MSEYVSIYVKRGDVTVNILNYCRSSEGYAYLHGYCQYDELKPVNLEGVKNCIDELKVCIDDLKAQSDFIKEMGYKGFPERTDSDDYDDESMSPIDKLMENRNKIIGAQALIAEFKLILDIAENIKYDNEDESMGKAELVWILG